MITVSAQIGTPRGVPDSARISLDSGASVKGASTKSKFHSMLEQYHASGGSAPETDDAQGPTERRQKDSDSATTLAAPQPVTSAMEAPRPILPLTPSITLRQDASSSKDDTATENANASTGSTGAADSAISQSKLDLHAAAIQSKTTTKSKAESKELVPCQSASTPPVQTAQLDGTAPADPSIKIPGASSSALEQVAPVARNSSAPSDTPDTVSTSTADRAIAYQYDSSNQRAAETQVIRRAGQEQPKVSDPTAAIPVPPPVTNTVDPQSLLHSAAVLNAPRQSAKALNNESKTLQDSSFSGGTDAKSTLPPSIESSDNTATGSDAGALAFAARLTPTTELHPPTSEATRPAELLPGAQTSRSTASAVSAKQISMGTDLPQDPQRGEGGGKPSDLFAKPDALVPQMHIAVADQGAAPANSHASASPLSPAAQMAQIIEPPANPPRTNNDITVRIPDSSDQGTAIRFVERAGEIHVSVRTGDAEMAQSLRSGLNDLVNHLQDGGLRTEMWQPGAGSNGAFSQNDSHHPFADPDGSNGRQYQTGSNSGQESKQQNRPRWVEELEGSIGNPNFKETTNLVWQA